MKRQTDSFVHPSARKRNKKAKRFKSQHPALVSKLNLTFEVDATAFFKVVLKNLEEKPDLKQLLSYNPKYPFKNYSVVPTIKNLLREQTQIISCPIVINNMEKMNLSFRGNESNIYSDKTNLTPKFLVLSTNPMPDKAVWPIELKYYIDTLAKTYKFRTNNFTYSESFIYSELQDSIELSKKNAITFISMGKESFWSLSILMRNTDLKKIVVVFVDHANYGISYREKDKFDEFSRWFSKNNIDHRVTFLQVNYDLDIVGIQSKEVNLTIKDEKIKEPLVKIQFMQLLTVPIIKEFKCGIFVAPMDFEEKNCNPLSHFGDQSVSFLSFNSFFSRYIGGKMKLKFQGLTVTRQAKTIHLIEIGWFKFVSSCYMNWNFFNKYQTECNINPELNMCGVCWKCKEDLKMFSTSPFQNLIKIHNNNFIC